jgi:tetratricopeptide (TPR) repeat protein
VAQDKGLNPIRDAFIKSELQRRLVDVRTVVASTKKEKPGFFADVWNEVEDSSKTVLKWLIIAAGLIVLVLAAAFLGVVLRNARNVQKGVGIALEDLTAEPAKRPNSNRALGRELSVAIAAASQSTTDEPHAEIDVVKDLDGSVSVNVRVVGDDLATLDPYLDDGSPVKVGPIAVSPRQLFAFVSTTFARRYEYELHGYFAKAGSSNRLDVELRHGKDPAVRWSCIAEGEDGRGVVVVEAARRLLFEAATKRISPSWRSVSAYREARAKLAVFNGKGDRSAVLTDVCRLLERSLAHDPANVLARFELGTALRKLGMNDDAIAQYEFLESLPKSRAEEAPTSLRRAIHYSRAIALSKIDRWETHKAALKSLDELRQDVEGDKTLNAPERERLLLLIHSALAATKVFEAEQLRSESDRDRTRRRNARVLASIKKEWKWIKGAPEREPGLDWPTYVQARAVAENAVGRATYLNGRPFEEVIEAFNSALSLAPELGDAHVNTASALRRARNRYSDWADRMEHHLTRALEISPRDRKALYLKGERYRLIGNDEDARKAYEAAAEAGDDWAHLRLAELLWEKGEKEKAIVEAQRSLARGRAHDHRARQLVLWTAELAEKESVKRATLIAARRAGEDLRRFADKRKKSLSTSLKDALALIDAKLEMPHDGASSDGKDDDDLRDD